MNYCATLLVVTDIEQSKQFYLEVLGLKVVEDFGANVTLTGGIALQTRDTWKYFICKPAETIVQCNNACELYFEEDDMDSFVRKMENFPEVEYVHPLQEHAWGQRVVRFYDPDGHIIEVGENMSTVVKQFLGQGLSVEQTASRMDVSVDYVRSMASK